MQANILTVGNISLQIILYQSGGWSHVPYPTADTEDVLFE